MVRFCVEEKSKPAPVAVGRCVPSSFLPPLLCSLPGLDLNLLLRALLQSPEGEVQLAGVGHTNLVKIFYFIRELSCFPND